VEVIYQGTTWRRQVTITDDAEPPNPVDPTQMKAVLCVDPELLLTITGPDDPGVYLVSLDDAQTADLPPRLTTHWEMIGRRGGDVVPLVHEDIYIEPRCARIDP
jgi:hypothetical protein